MDTPTIANDHSEIKPKSISSFFKSFTEDIWAVVNGSLIILSVLFWVTANPTWKFKPPVYSWKNSYDLFNKVFDIANLSTLAMIWAVFILLSSLAAFFSGAGIRKFVAGFTLIYLLGITSLIIAGNSTVSKYGLEYVVFALALGLSISNLFRLPSWIQTAAKSEFYIKTGLVILGTSVLFTDIVKAGLPGILQSLAVVSVVWFFAMWISRKLKVDDEFAVILASAVSICGVSAAIVASGAIQGDKKKLSYVTTLVLLVAIPMLVLQPWLIREFNIPELVGGAWLGGTLDTTASVTAAAELVGPVATKAGVIIKFSQNVLIGIAAFFIASWWAFRNKGDEKTETPGIRVVWERFPKFVLGFIAVSLVFSFLIDPSTVKQTSGLLNSLRTIWFALAFLSIGIEARIGDLIKVQEGRPALSFVIAQLFNLVWTLLLAYLLFGGVLFDVPDIK